MLFVPIVGIKSLKFYYIDKFMQGKGVHMCLAHVAQQSSDYRVYYRKLAEDSYVIMDNGAAEGQLMDIEELLKMVYQVKPTEVVVRDSLNNMEKTLHQFDVFPFEEMISLGVHSFMLVPQGQTIEEYLECTKELLERANHMELNFTLGISRFMNKVGVSRPEYMEKVREVILGYVRPYEEIHILGCNSLYEIREIQEAHKAYLGGVIKLRSFDTGLAEISAQKGQTITANGRSEHLDFFSEETNSVLLMENLKILDKE